VAVNLTTKVRVKTFMGLDLDTQDDDDLLDMLIDAVSRQIAAHCHRTFEETTYKIWLDGNGDRRLRLPQYPITKVYGVAINTITVGRIQYSGSGVLASIYLDPDVGISLVNDDAAGSDDIATFSLSGRSVSELASAITASSSVSDWALTASSGKDNYPMSQVQPIGAGDAKSPSDLALEHPDTYQEGQLVSNSEDTIELMHTCFPWGHNNIFVWYVAGYTLPNDADDDHPSAQGGTIPQGLEMICQMAIRDVFRAKDKDTAMESERLGDYQYKLSANAITEAVKRYEKELWPWCRKEI